MQHNFFLVQTRLKHNFPQEHWVLTVLAMIVSNKKTLKINLNYELGSLGQEEDFFFFPTKK